MTSATHTAVLIAVSLLRSEKTGYLSLSLSFLLVLLLPRSLSFLSRSHLIPCFLPSCLVTLLFFQPSHQKSNGGTVTLRSHIKCVHFKHIDISTRYIPSPSCYVCMSWLFHLRRRKRRQGGKARYLDLRFLTEPGDLATNGIFCDFLVTTKSSISIRYQDIFQT